jgi:hypothetical protein
MRKAAYIAFFLLAWSFFVFGDSPTINAQTNESESEYHPNDTVFEEMVLTEEGITAVDTSGYEWYYDFDKRTFVAGDPPELTITIDGQGRRTIDLSSDELDVELRCTEEKLVKPFEHLPVWVGYEEYVEGDIIAYHRVTIKGWVKGDVKSFKKVFVSASGQVDGNVEAPAIIDKGLILGEKIISSSPLEVEDIARSFTVDGVIIVASFTVFFLFCGFLAVTLMPRQMTNFGQCLSRHKVKSFFLGLLFMFLLPVMVMLVTVTVVGVILVPFVPLIYLLACVLGIVTFGNVIGYRFSQKYLGGEKSKLFQSSVGILLLMTFWMIVAILLGANDDVSQGFGIFFLVLSILLSSFPITLNLQYSLASSSESMSA